MSHPLWVELALYPGFLAGYFTYQLIGNEIAAIVTGCAAVGLCYGTFAWLVQMLVQKIVNPFGPN